MAAVIKSSDVSFLSARSASIEKNGGATRCNQLHGNEGGDIYGRDPVSENTRAIVTAGFAKDVDEVNQ
jgi:hypothetical protein